MPTPEYKNVSNFIKGIRVVEDAINISDFRQSFTDEKIFIEDKSGSPKGFVHNFLVSSNCTITGEISTATIPAALGVAFGTAETVANAIAGFHVGATAGGYVAGGWYLDDIEISQSRGALATATANFTRHPDIT
jgi:hypothetical protein